MHLTSSPIALPGSCKGCGSGTRFPFVDTTWSEEYHGAIYFCVDCVGSMADLFGFISPEKAAALKAEIETLSARVYELERDNRSLNYLQEAVNDVFTRGNFSNANSAFIDGRTGAMDGEVPPDSDAPEGSGDTGTPKSSDDKGVVKLPTGSRGPKAINI